MNVLDYLLLVALTIAALYTFYRLLLGYLASRSLDPELSRPADLPNSSRAEARVANLKR